MDIVQAIILGIVQGVTEILPISSSGHLVLVPWVLNFRDPGLAFDVALHLGTLLAIVCFFYADILMILKGGIGFFVKKDPSDLYQKLFLFLIVATIPGIAVGYFLNDYAEGIFRNPLLIATTVFFFGIVLFLADNFDLKPKNIEKITFFDSQIIGISQALAIIPGVSRSGITISAGLFRKLKREDAAKFSFLLSVPIILGAAIFEFKNINVTEILSPVIITGFLSAAISGFLSVKFLLNFIKKHNFNIFVYYRFFLAAAIILLYYFK